MLRTAPVQQQKVWTRGFASRPTEPKENVPKPKAATPLRRAAAASLPIRSNPTPTRSAIQPVFTLTTAERYILSEARLRPYLPETAQVLQESWWIPRWRANGKEGEIFIFGNGSFVCWGLGEEEANTFANEVLRKARVETRRMREPETEDLEFVTDPSQATRLQGDLIILGQTQPNAAESDAPPSDTSLSTFPADTLLARYAFSQALARSTALSAIEVSLEKYLSSMADLPDSLIRTGKPGLERVALVKKLGELLKFRQGLNLNSENYFDTPDFYWAEPVLEAYFNSLSNALEMKTRVRVLNEKITYAAETQSVLRQLLTETSAHQLELIITILIAVEVVICLIRDGPELWDMVRGKKEEPKVKAV
ncbi:hypothetical protein BDW22DRAFT_1330016 [Trametopsis cervina]|nr:hypothetical protein BDW22DRAFT_1330016 [Trametopsis cervina]